MKYCGYCGKSLNDDVAFCTGCGKRCRDEVKVSAVSQKKPQQDRPPSAGKKPVSGKKVLSLWVLLGLSILVAIVSAVMGFSALMQDEEALPGQILQSGETINTTATWATEARETTLPATGPSTEPEPTVSPTEPDSAVSPTEPDSTVSPTEPEPTVSPTEPPRDIPDGVLLIDGAWKNGDVTVVVLDGKTLWIRITDNRTNQEYDDLGTPWELFFEYGEPFYTENSNGVKIHHSPYVIQLQSTAHGELLAVEYEQGNTPGYFEEEYSKTLWLAKTVLTGGGNTFRPSVYADVAIEKAGNTYTAIISVPEWFATSLTDDLVKMYVYLYTTDYWSELCEKGSASRDAYYIFEPIND